MSGATGFGGVVAYVVLCFVFVIVVLVVFASFGSISGGCKTKSRSACRGQRQTANTGVTPAGFAVTLDGRFAFVANNNNYAIIGSDSVSVIDLHKNVLVATIEDASFSEPYTVTLSKCGKKAYVTNSAGTTVTIIDTCTRQVTGTITGFDGPSGFVIIGDDTAYVNNYGSAAGVGSGNGTMVRRVDLVNNVIVGPPITVGLAPAAMHASADECFVYVVNYTDGNPGTGSLSVISTDTNVVTSTLASGFSGPFGIDVTPDGKLAVVTNFGSNNFEPYGTTVSVVDLEELEIIRTIPVGIQPSGVVVSPDNCHAYVTNYNTLYAGPMFTDLTAGEGTVNEIDLYRGKATRTLLVGQSPSAIVWIPGSHHTKLAISNYTSNTLTQISV